MTGGPATAPRRSRRDPIAALRHRNFRFFWTGQLVSLTGTWMAQVAQAWLVLQLTNEPLALGVVVAVQYTPVLAFGLLGGVVADALPKRRTLVAAQALMALVAFTLAGLVIGRVVEVWHVIVLAALLGLANAIEMPTRQSFVMEMVGREHIANAVALSSAVFNGTRILGPAIAGLLIGGLGVEACFLLNGFSYLAVIGGLLAIRPGELHAAGRPALERSVGAVGRHLAEGIRYIVSTPAVALPLAVLGIVSTVGMNFQVLMPVMARDELDVGAWGLGFLLAATGVGSLAAALAIAFGLRPNRRLLLAGALGLGLCEFAFAISRLFPLSLALAFGMGFGVIALAATTNTTIQLTAPDALRGRVMSVYVTVFAGSTPIGGLLAGSIASTWGAPVAFLAGGAVSVAVALGAFLAAGRWDRTRGDRGERTATVAR